MSVLWWMVVLIMLWLAFTPCPASAEDVQDVRIKSLPEDLVVEEVIALPVAPGGAYTVYRLQKRGITTLQAQAQLAAALGVPRSAVAFPALKDKDAQATQYGTV
jgi:tRNA pseudouridine13 synthase